MSVQVLGRSPDWLRPLAMDPPGADCDAIVVVNDLSEGVLRNLARARAMLAQRPQLAVAMLTVISPVQSPADAVLSALPPGVQLPAQPGLAMALIGARWPRAVLRADPEAVTFEYQG